MPFLQLAPMETSLSYFAMSSMIRINTSPSASSEIPTFLPGHGRQGAVHDSLPVRAPVFACVMEEALTVRVRAEGDSL